jgi:pimeloyl-ACP methyl ester carboxylesterase
VLGRRAGHLANSSQDFAVGKCRQRGNPDDAAARRFDLGLPGSQIFLIAAAPHQHVRQYFRDQGIQRALIKDHRRIHAFQRSHQFGALPAGNQRVGRAALLLNSRIAGDSNKKRVAERARLLEHANVAGVKKVEGPGGENQGAIAFFACEPDNRFLYREKGSAQCLLRISNARQVIRVLLRCHGNTRRRAPSGCEMTRARLPSILAGLLLFGAGLALVLAGRRKESQTLVPAGDCILSVHTFEPDELPARGSVVLLHGLAANERLMDYYTRGFLAAGLRVIAPDFPGHGRSPGGFSPLRAESCSEALLVDAMRRGQLEASRTLLIGHSLGAAIALRVASRQRVAGVIAISPAPMLLVSGSSPELLLYAPPEKLPPNTLILSGGLEPQTLRRATEQLMIRLAHVSAEYRPIPGASHTSLLFDAEALRASLDWAVRVLDLGSAPALPSRSAYLGFLAGLAGLVLLVGTSLRASFHRFREKESDTPRIPVFRGCLELAAVSAFAIGVLRFAGPLRLFGLYTGDYLASFLLVAGILLLAMHIRGLMTLLPRSWKMPALAVLLGLATSLVFLAWVHLTITTAVLDGARVWRLAVLSIALLPISAAEEVLLGSPQASGRLWRLAHALTLRFVAWLGLAGALFYLHSGQALLGLLVPYFAFFSVLQRLGVDLVRKESGSPLGAALFGAILAAAFFVLVFPLT